MKNKIIFIILVVITLFTVTGCGMDKNSEPKREFTCIKKGMERVSDTTGHTYILDSTFTAKLDEEGKLVNYTTKSTYTMKTKDECNKACEKAQKWNEEVNNKNYSESNRVTTCNCDNYEYTEEYTYDTIVASNRFERGETTELVEDTTFDLDLWKSRNKKNGYTCD